MNEMGISLLIFLSTVSGLQAAKDYRNQTVECTFNEINKCWSLIPALGGDFSAKFADNSTAMNQTCKMKEPFRLCIEGVPQMCNIKLVTPAVRDIVTFVSKLCINSSTEYNNFLNSSVCYNKYQSMRRRCVENNKPQKNDAKTLCCKSKKTQECLEGSMTSVCPKNSTSFQNQLISRYSSYTNFLCTPYMQYCGAVSNFLSFGCVLLTAKLVLLNFF